MKSLEATPASPARALLSQVRHPFLLHYKPLSLKVRLRDGVGLLRSNNSLCVSLPISFSLCAVPGKILRRYIQLYLQGLHARTHIHARCARRENLWPATPIRTESCLVALILTVRSRCVVVIVGLSGCVCAALRTHTADIGLHSYH